MNAIEMLVQQLDTVNLRLHHTAGDLTPHELTARVLDGVNPLGFIVWHMARSQDWAVHTAIRDVPEVITREPWSRSPIAIPGIGTGFDASEARAVAKRVDLALLLDYADVVHADSVAWLRTRAESALDEIPDVAAHDAPHPEYQTAGFRAEMDSGPEHDDAVGRKGGLPVWVYLTSVSVTHLHRHLGEVDLIKDVIRRGTLPNSWAGGPKGRRGLGRSDSSARLLREGLGHMQTAIEPAEIFGSGHHLSREAVRVFHEVAAQPVRVLVGAPQGMLDPVKLLAGPFLAHVTHLLQVRDDRPPRLGSLTAEDGARQACPPAQPLQLPGELVLWIGVRMKAERRHLLDSLRDHVLGRILQLDARGDAALVGKRPLREHGHVQVVAGVDVVRDLVPRRRWCPRNTDVDLEQESIRLAPREVQRRDRVVRSSDVEPFLERDRKLLARVSTSGQIGLEGHVPLGLAAEQRALLPASDRPGAREAEAGGKLIDLTPKSVELVGVRRREGAGEEPLHEVHVAVPQRIRLDLDLDRDRPRLDGDVTIARAVRRARERQRAIQQGVQCRPLNTRFAQPLVRTQVVGDEVREVRPRGKRQPHELGAERIAIRQLGVHARCLCNRFSSRHASWATMTTITR
jgi:hypothetical protein